VQFLGRCTCRFLTCTLAAASLYCRLTKEGIISYFGIFFKCVSSLSCSLFVHISRHAVITRESSYCFQRVLAIAILSVRLSVHLSVTRVDQSKVVQARITKSSPSAVWKTLVSGTVKLFHKFEGVTPNKGA